MNISIGFMRGLFALLCVFFMLAYVTAHDPFAPERWIIGIGAGLAFAGVLFGFDLCFRRFHLRSFNITIVGLFIGFFMGKALVLIFNTVTEISYLNQQLSSNAIELIRICLFLFSTYLGVLMTLRFSDEFYLSIPFVRFDPVDLRKRDLILDRSILTDTRLVDLAATGLLDGYCVIPRFTVRELYTLVEATDERLRHEGRRGLEIIKKLEDMAHLQLRWQDNDFPEIHDHAHKVARLARLLKANILTAEIGNIPLATSDGIQVVSMNALSGALKPLMHEGEHLSIKIQRQGKEPRQGIGYLDDGTMVVVNGAGFSIGKTVQATVLSIKASSAGRIIFANLVEGDGIPMYGDDE